MAVSVKELRRRGYSPDDIAAAQAHQQNQQRLGVPVDSLVAILTGRRRPDPTAPTDLTVRQLRKRGIYGQVALALDQAALQEKDPDRAKKARQAATMAKQLAAPRQLEFELYGRGDAGKGNVMTGDQYHDAIRDRLMALKDITPAERLTALAVLKEITRWLGWQVFTCTKTAAELGELLGIERANMSRTLALLEGIGAITRIKRGRTKTITVTPEGVYRGHIEAHPQVMSRYRAEVVPLRPGIQGQAPDAG